MKYYVTSDVHGFYTLLREKLEQAGYFTDSQPHKLLILGDLFDRGKEAWEMQRFILDEMKADRAILIRGNHEDLFRELITTDGGWPLSHHVSNGTFSTALQLTGLTRARAMADLEEFCERAWNTPYNRQIIPAMLDYYETQHFVFVHGWIPCIQERDKTYSYIENWRDADISMWQTARWINGMKAVQTCPVPGKTVFCGHWHASYGHSKFEGKGSEFGEDADFSPYMGNGIIAIDASTANSGMVNCIIIEDEEAADER